ncbi:glycerol-3-phosphate 1-O-acyltransferase PlsY [Tahibacter amnicola]|uniref:Glycerol-3-phosphate acyltransferase n=1 Tax=Tahibacter amnicola TaxID=2976241 RepID=A0ABY6BD92_9GAMM|nr:glycerol-3-phosphate 1-O-acyltransferase PlsY [Tahibacter amnicola]UXI67800.1 glycerol-3-phosphate 1-O-acyltransferase PlsY [Tahibacter amnicola]
MIFLFKLVIAYLLGSVSGSLVLGRRQGVDIRTQGSGNAGGTNALRTRGWRFALGVVIIDIGKGALAAAVGLYAAAQNPAVAWSCGFAAVLGHVFPVFFGFRGGKGAATLVGVVLALHPVMVLPLLGAWLLVLTGTGYVGLATVTASVVYPVAVALLVPADRTQLLFALASAALLVWTHRGNLVRLRRGVEYRFERARLFRRLFRKWR